MSEQHPHDGVAEVPDRLPAAQLRELSRLQPARALTAIAVEWAVIAAAIALAHAAQRPLVTLLAIVVIGARQHALAVIAHDASHFRLLPQKRLNDIIGNVCLAWPLFISVAGFREFHGSHHKYLGEARDGNRQLWRTHDGKGELVAEWRYPKTRAQLLALLLRRTLLLTGIRWVLRGLISLVVLKREPLALRLLRACCYALLAAGLTHTGLWAEFALLWLLPLCTWHITIQYMRLIAEHSAVHSDDPALQVTRTTIPTRVEALLMLPRNIGYHIEHHWYPSVPFYNLPALHERLMQSPRFAAHADISRSLLRSLLAVTRAES